jgi:tetratricopeptide (TPR) repeat protein
MNADGNSLSNAGYAEQVRNSMDPLPTIRQAARQTALRLRRLRGWEGLWRGGLIGAALLLAVLGVWKLAPIPFLAVPVAGAVAAVAPLLGFAIGYWPRLTEEQAARWLDQKQRLKERLSTALELSSRPLDSRWQQLVLADAQVAAAQVDPRRLLPLALPRVARGLAAVLAGIVALGLLPEYRSQAHVQQKKDAEVIKETGQQLSSLIKRSLEQRKPTLETTRKSLDEVKELGDRLQAAKLTRDEALKDLAKATDQLKQQSAELSKNPTLKKMEQAARTPGGNAPQRTPEALQKAVEQAQKQLGDKAGKEDALDQLQRDTQKLQEAAKGLADNNPGAAPAAKEALAKMASELARKAESMGMPLPSLDEAVAALQNAQVEQFLKDLDVAEHDLEKLADMAKTLAQRQQQAEKLGKDLGEQLKNGQAEAAIESLQKMMEQLKKGGLTPEQLAKLAEELQKGVKPGQQYGKTGGHLGKALEALKKQGASSGECQQGLADAQSELRKLLDQMNDAQALMSALQNLQKAQACVGNCQSWGSRPGNIPRAGKSGKGGKGVGTWSDSSAWSMPDHIDDFWDNSNVNRPDQAARGHTERDAGTPDNLAPTKVRGQIQPGGPMPSITLKGVSIKGESKVAYTEAITAAQSEAQAALNQEQVPKAYRTAVRDYFDDIKR